MEPTNIFYHPKMVVEGLDSYSPSAGKPGIFVDGAKASGLTSVIHTFRPVKKSDICIAHDTSYVDGVFDLTTPNGFDNRDPRIPPSTRWTIGSLAAALLARSSLKGSVCSPTSGFHHAGHAFGGGFCTFNGLMVAAGMYLKKHPLHKVGILDCDVHYGNGTDDILDHEKFFAGRVIHRTAGGAFTPGSNIKPGIFMNWLDEAIEDVKLCDAVIYQAGADMAAGDPLGGYLSPTAMHIRDTTVFDILGKKIVWNLAGGYQDIARIITIHMRTAWIAARESVYA